VPKSIWSKIYPADEKNLCNWKMRCLLAEWGGRRVLFDTGMGDKQDAKFFGHYFLNGEGSLLGSLAQAGYQPEDITDVVLTHLHFDHVGGAVRREADGTLVPTFPNATYHVGRRQWDWACAPNAREKASFLPENFLPLREAGRLNLVEHEGELLPGLEVRFFDGHTIGQMAAFLRTPKGTLVYAADVLPSAAHVPMPYVMAYDVQPLVTLHDKKRLFDLALAEGHTFFLEHDLPNECCQLEAGPKGVQVKRTFRLDEF